MITYYSSNIIHQPSGIFSNLITTSMIRDLHLHDGFYELMVVFRGSLQHNAEGETRQMRSGDLVFMPNGTMHTLYDSSEDLMFLNIAVLPIVLSQAMGYLKLPAVSEKIVFSHISQPILDFLLWNYVTFMKDAESGLQDSVDRNGLALLLPHCCNTEPVSDWFELLLTQMKRRENFQIGISRMQELAFCSPAHLCRTCKLRLGMTPTQFIEKTRIEYASQLLLHTDYSIRDVGIECGFCNLSYFYRCFERHMGMSPGKFRSLDSHASKCREELSDDGTLKTDAHF